MRGELSTVLQTLTPEAAAVLNQSIAEAGHRKHCQTTPLHVAATLLGSPSGYLREACTRAHPNSSHPLQCRALELCFRVVLERLPTAQNEEPPMSNALMAALKRAQAHQRRGCPELQQQPLLAVKVELEQLIISILDDPSVSRVMREASFSSSAVKATIEQSLNQSNSSTRIARGNVSLAGIGPRIISNSCESALQSKNIHLNPRLQQRVTGGMMKNQKGEHVEKVLEIMRRSKGRNPVLVGDSEPEAVVKELLRELENKEQGIFKNLQVLSLEKGLPYSDKNQVVSKFEELGVLIGMKIMFGGVILNLGDLKWLVEHPQKPKQFISESVKATVSEMTRLLGRYGEDGGGNKLWLTGTATCETYLRCQVHHSNLETDWDLQAVPIASKSPLQATSPRLGTERMLNNWLNTKHASENIDPTQRSNLCPHCTENYQRELEKLKEIGDSLSESPISLLPQWLQSASIYSGKDQELVSKQKSHELQKKWRDICIHHHIDFHQNVAIQRKTALPVVSSIRLLPCSPFQQKLQVNTPLKETLQLNMNQLMFQQANSAPRSPVGTELALGTNIITHCDDQVKDFLGCISSEPRIGEFAKALDTDAYKKLLKGLMEKAWWQPEAASSVASAITRFRSGEGKRFRGGSRGDLWLLFTGPERVGKRKIASVLSEQICGTNLILICLGKRRDEEESDTNFRGRMGVDRIAEAVRRNPFSVIMLEDIDEADVMVQGSIKRAIERGRLMDSHGCEVGLGKATIIVTGDWSTTRYLESGGDALFVDEKRVVTEASGSWKLGLIVRDRGTKRRANIVLDEERPLKLRKEMGMAISLDLNLAVTDCYTEDDITDGSINDSDLTMDRDDEGGLSEGPHFSVASVPHELSNNVEDMIAFKPVEYSFVRREIRTRISEKFSSVVGSKLSIEIRDDVVEKILRELWHDKMSLSEWIENVVQPSFEELKLRLPQAGERSDTVVRLVVESDTCDRGTTTTEWLPRSILV